MAGDYFGSMAIPLVRGRLFDRADAESESRVAVLNQALVEAHWGGEEIDLESVLGRRVAILGWGPEPTWYQVVGVVSDVHSVSVAGGDSPAIYIPYAQRPISWGRFGTLVARGALDADQLTRALHEAVWAVDAGVPLFGVTTLVERVSRATARERFTTTLLGIFAVFALVIAVQGLYGVMVTFVSSRRQELGVRMAVGATRSGVITGIVVRGLAHAAVGLAVGIIIALMLSNGLDGLLFGVTAQDPGTYFLVGALVTLVALLASLAPALRTLSFDPARILRSP